MKNKWYSVSLIFKTEMRNYICQFDENIKKSVFSKKDSDFVKVKKVRWLNYDKKKRKYSLMKLEDSGDKGYMDYFYTRKEFIESIWPIKDRSILNK
ncbi:MAG: hypothetical protein ABH848_03315 [Candidatus Omnitrophota bacterium]